MRLGGYFRKPSSVADLDTFLFPCDAYGLSAIPAPAPEVLLAMPDGECERFGARARELGLVVGESGMWSNLMTDDAEKRKARVEQVRGQLLKADRMGCRCVVVGPGSKAADDGAFTPHADNYGEPFRRELREVVLQILDGLDLKVAKLLVEPWHNTFFYQPEEIREFLDRVDHPRFSFHFDQMNMVNQATFYRTTELVERTFALLADRMVSAHLKDIQVGPWAFLRWDEVYIGDGVLDYDTLLKRLAALPQDIACFCEHLKTEADHVLNFARLHCIAERNGVRFLRRGEGF